VTDLSDPYGNFRVGCDYLGELLAQYGDGTDIGTHKALMAYNLGPSGASRLWARGIFETDYSRAVLEAAELLGY
jgi:soluble lytic murein transglycosylase-like protein